MKAKDIYKKETGSVAPTNQIAYHEWHQKYVQWMEKKIENQHKRKTKSHK